MTSSMNNVNHGFYIVSSDHADQIINFTVKMSYEDIKVSEDCILVCMTSPVPCDVIKYGQQLQICQILQSTSITVEHSLMIVDASQLSPQVFPPETQVHNIIFGFVQIY